MAHAGWPRRVSRVYISISMFFLIGGAARVGGWVVRGGGLIARAGIVRKRSGQMLPFCCRYGDIRHNRTIFKRNPYELSNFPGEPESFLSL